jgi:hypothetical protein
VKLFRRVVIVLGVAALIGGLARLRGKGGASSRHPTSGESSRLMTDVLLAGTGEVAVRTARQLLDSDGVDRLLVASNDAARAERVAHVFGDRVSVCDWTPDTPLPDVAVIVSARASDHPLARAAIEAGTPFVSCDDDQVTIFHLLGLDELACSHGVTVAIGAGLAPGIADLLTRHAADEFDHVDEIRVARVGAAGPESVSSLRRDLRSAGVDWHDAEYRNRPAPGDELVWFPEPIGAVQCDTAVLGLRLLVDAFGEVPRISVLAGAVPVRDRRRVVRRRAEESEWGGVRVELWGTRDGAHGAVVYGLVDRTAVAAGTMLAVTALRLGGLGTTRIARPGVHGVARLLDPVEALAELAERGVRAARFEGAPVG